MNNREKVIYDFLMNARFLLSSSDGVQHYTAKQINMFSDLAVKENELKVMEKKGFLTHVYCASHGNCYIIKEI